MEADFGSDDKHSPCNDNYLGFDHDSEMDIKE